MSFRTKGLGIEDGKLDLISQRLRFSFLAGAMASRQQPTKAGRRGLATELYKQVSFGEKLVLPNTEK